MQQHLSMTSSDTILGFILRLVPDLVICWVAAHLTNSGWYGFFVALLCLQAIYFFLSLKTALWRWFTFRIFRKKMIATAMENFLIANRFPAPDKYTIYEQSMVYEDYMSETANNEEFDANIRVIAAFELGSINGLRSSGFWQLHELLRAGQIATQRYARLANNPGHAVDKIEKTAKLSDDDVTATQADFERRLDENVDLPDGIRCQPAFIYRHLMREWFNILMASNRYDEKVYNKIKSDWLDYMDCLEQKETSGFLSLEAEDEEKREFYDREFFLHKRKIELIENGFAAAVGKEAIEQLERVRSGPFDAFDITGKKPMAPIGYYYFPVSLKPHDQELSKRPE